MKIVTLLSDFGARDGYVAQMKGTILNIYPNVVVTDISHEVERHNIAMGSFILETTAPYFPTGTIHVAVVDPGVGSARKPLVIECEKATFVGPDNGLMARASEKLGLEAIYEIREKEFQGTRISSTFHGRDIFAYTAGLIASGRRPREAGPKVSKLETLNLVPPKLSGDLLVCHVLHVDAFGNVITNVDEKMTRKLPLKVGETLETRSWTRKLQAQFVRSYYELDIGAAALLLGSQGFLEIAVREGSARDKLDVKPLDHLEIQF
ncbi:MAG TPA: S-adenosyl-l-methionine hydroxide adenosyltransferase family protein [Candidatus Bathyarchaeia archaeon]|nr:S-adenosyl-l-methionine hydroxide adenosyltransferase family protein [Candidatus Bathyarchaeia archaeon]